MIGRTNMQLKTRVLLVDDDLASLTTARGRVLNALVDEFHNRNIEVVKSASFEDGMASVVSDAALQCICVRFPGFEKEVSGGVHKTAPETSGA